MLSRTSPTPPLLILLVVLAFGLTGLADATQTTTLNATTMLSEDAGILGRLSIGTTTLDTTGAALHIEGTTLANGTINATKYQLGSWGSFWTGNLTNTTLSGNRTWSLQDLDGTLGMIDATQTVTGAWTFSTNPVFNANGISWTSLSKSGSSLADLTTRSATDLTSGTLSDARLSANVPLLNAANAYTNAGTNTYTGSLAATIGYFPKLIANTSLQTNTILDANGHTWLQANSSTNAVNYFQVNNSATGQEVNISAAGTDTNINISIVAKGTGDFRILDGADLTKVIQIDPTAAATGTTTILSSAATTSRTLTLPDATGTLLSDSGAQTIGGTKTFTTPSSTTFTGSLAAPTGYFPTTTSNTTVQTTNLQDLSGNQWVNVSTTQGTGNSITLQTNNAAGSVGIMSAGGANVGLTLYPKGNKHIAIADGSDATKILSLDPGAQTTGTTTTLSFTSTAARTLTFPDTTATLATRSDNLGQFASTTSAQLASTISDESGTGSLIFATSPTFVTPNIADAIANTVVATGKVVGAYGYFDNLVSNVSLTFNSGSGATLVDSGKVAASNGFFPNAQVNTTLIVGQASQSKDEVLGVTPTASIAGTASPWSSPGLKMPNATVTYTGATGETTFVFINDIGIPTLTASATPATVPIAASFRVEGQPTCNSSGGAAITCTTALGLWASGTTRLDGQVSMTGTGAAPSGAARLSITPSTTTAGSSSVRTGAITLPANTLTFTGGTAQSGDLIDSDIGIRTYTAATTAGTSTNAATLKVDGAPVCNSSGGAAQTCTNLQAFWVAGGLTQLDGNVKIGASGTSIGFFGAAVHAKDTLTDSTGGTTGTSCAAITAGVTYTQADGTAVKNCLASLLLVMHDYGMVG